MASIVDSTAKCNDLLGAASRALENVVRSHVSAQGKFEEIKVHIGFLRRMNDLMMFFGVLAVVLFCLKVFHIYPFRS
jgi:hypothetical protein